MTRTPHPRLLGLLAALLSAVLLGPLTPAPAPAAWVSVPLEPFAQYERPGRCTPTVKPGTRLLGRWLVARFGSRTTMARACEWGEVVSSEHQEGRAIDWYADADTAQGRRDAKDLVDELLAPDRWGNVAVRARRMGVMYLIWDDRIYSAWNGFEPRLYLHDACTSRTKCSKTLRHRDHVHVSITRQASRARTSWFVLRGLTG